MFAACKLPTVMEFNYTAPFPDQSGGGHANGDVRLAGGVAGSSSGRVEMYVDGVWGSVCGGLGRWQSSSHNAATVCRQIGFPTEGEMTTVV